MRVSCSRKLSCWVFDVEEATGSTRVGPWEMVANRTFEEGAKVRTRWCSYIGCRYDEQWIWVGRGPRLMLYFFSRNWRVLTFQTALEEGKRVLPYFSDETCNRSWEGRDASLIKECPRRNHTLSMCTVDRQRLWMDSN